MVFLGALIVQLTAYWVAKSAGASLFVTAMIAATANDLCWVGGYQALAASRGWESLQRRFTPVAGKVLLASAAAALALILFVTSTAAILGWLGIEITGTPDNGVSARDLRHLPVAILFIVLVGPAAEELMFRGLLLDWLRQRLPVWPAMVLISLLFASVHGHSFGNGIAGLLALLDRFLIGMATSYLALRYQSLRPSFVLHATNNAVAATVLVLWR
jgi:membrane protease YdiL (CAAX protease family)